MLIITDGTYKIPKSDLYCLLELKIKLSDYINLKNISESYEPTIYCLGNLDCYELIEELIPLYEKLSGDPIYIVLPFGSTLEDYEKLEELPDEFIPVLSETLNLKNIIEEFLNR